MRNIKLVIINQSPKVTELLEEALNFTDTFNVIGIFTTVTAGKEFCEINQPDAILFDISLIELNLVIPIPTVLISDHPFKNTVRIVQAINSSVGVINHVKLPLQHDEASKAVSKEEIIYKIIKASKTNMSKHHKRIRQEIIKLPDYVQTKVVYQEVELQHKKKFIIGLGTSTGGPQALQALLATLPVSFEPPIFIVQHMPSNFTKTLAARLNNLTKVHVKEAVDGEIVKAGTVYIAPGDQHMKVIDVQPDLKIVLTQEPKKSGHRPSVDVLFDSLANINRMSKVAIILTGMGKDGSEGIKQIRRQDRTSITLAESDETAIIYGMPKAAIATGEIQEVIRLEELTKKLINYVK